MGTAPAQHVNVELVGLGEQQVGLVADEREALEEADADAAVGDHLRQRQRGGLDVQAALDDLEVRRDAAQVLVRRPVRQVAEAEGLADLAGREEFFELSSGVKRFGLVSSGMAAKEPARQCRDAPGMVSKMIMMRAYFRGYI